MANTYEPTPEDITWLLTMLSLVREGGVLAYPSTKLIYQVSHARRTLTLMNPDSLEDIDAEITHQRTILVANILRWYVRVNEDPPYTQ